MKKLRVMTVVGTRPEIIRLSRVMSEMDTHVDHHIVHTGQNYDYELNKIFFDDLELRAPDHYLNAAGNSAAETIGRVIEKTDKLLEELRPEALLVLGDTNSCLSAIPAKKRRIPIFHMEAGNRCFDQRVPEETNRKIVDHIADINMPYSSIAREYLLREGIPADRIIKTGSPMKEVLTHYRRGIESSRVLSELSLEIGKYFVVSSHREENVDSPRSLGNILAVLNRLAAEYREPIIVSTHPRTRRRLEESHHQMDPLIRTLPPLGFLDYVQLQSNARMVLSDSGTITEESAILGFPAINIREAHERPEGMEQAAVIMSGLEPDRVLQSIELAQRQTAAWGRDPVTVGDYDTVDVSRKVVRIVLSYVDYINNNVWKKRS